MTAPSSEATPRPWKVFSKNRIWYAGIDPEIGTVEIAKFGDMTDKELIPFNAQRWFADCALAVQAVNSYDEREALLRDALEYVDNARHSNDYTLSGRADAKALFARITAHLEAGK